MNPLLENPLKRAALSLMVLTLVLMLFPFVVLLKVAEAVHVSCDIGWNCLRSVWSDRW